MILRKTILISAGGTGGHIFPALAVAEELSKEYDIVWVGAKTGLENTLVPQHGINLQTINIGGVRNKGILRKILLPLVLIRALLQCITIIRRYKACAIVGFGGYVAFPIGLSAKLMGKPLIIHEQNSVAGLTNKILAKISNCVLTAFPKVLNSSKSHYVGNPVRQRILDLNKPRLPINLDDFSLKILIVGGSLGAQVLNDIVPEALARIANKVKSVTHQVGRGDTKVVANKYQAANINAQVVNFIDDMATAYLGHDIIICRAGASTVSEVAAAGILAIFVPYPHAVDDHQTANAGFLLENGAAYLIPQAEFSAQKLTNLLAIQTPEIINAMSLQAKKLAVNDSTQQICGYIIKLVK